MIAKKTLLLVAVISASASLLVAEEPPARPAVVISPGFRYAFNHPGDAQTVIGLAAPIGLTSAAPDFGVFIYGSFEHFFSRPKRETAGK